MRIRRRRAAKRADISKDGNTEEYAAVHERRAIKSLVRVRTKEMRR
jgi:hypothetical protein